MSGTCTANLPTYTTRADCITRIVATATAATAAKALEDGQMVIWRQKGRLRALEVGVLAPLPMLAELPAVVPGEHHQRPVGGFK